MTSDELHAIEQSLDSLLDNIPADGALADAIPPEIGERLQRLTSMLHKLSAFALQLSAGNVDAEAPPRSNYLASGLKQLQAQMLHLTWQAQCVAQGDYMQRIDFMGDFSKAFNEMVDQLRQREASLNEQREVMERIFNVIEPIIVVKTENPSEILYINEMAKARFGARPGENTHYHDSLARILGLSPSNVERQIFDEDNRRWYGVTAHKLNWGPTQAMLFYCRDITSHKEREDTLSAAASTDDLTGTKNRRAFDQAYSRLWNTCRSAQKPMSIMVFDLDHFKDFNDNYGHLEGDKMLAAFAQILNRRIGRGDDLISRYGGEEFVAALPFTGRDDALAIANAIVAATAAFHFTTKNSDGTPTEASITVSVGVSTIIPTFSVTPSLLVKAADNAVYQAKEQGRNRVNYSDISDL